ncbi:FixH family protein [Joostella sp.]|uniref:FixH family protein n=1 Tax=Joostella sp. TaxID=2231138 RepID=UPI003A9250E6
MKFNWGTGIVVAFILFISFILYLVIRMNTEDAYDHHLVSKDYYKKELEYQSKIDNAQKAKEKGYQLKAEKTSEGVLVTFPSEMDAQDITGEVFLYRPSNDVLDFKSSIKVSNSTFLIPQSKLPGGRWNIEVNWTYNDENYYYKKELSL